MKIITRDFGEVDIDPGDIVTFRQPIFGFEGLTQFVFLSDPGIGGHFTWLQSLESQDICFILADPLIVADHYAPHISKEVEDILGKGEYTCWLVVVIPESFEDATVNLKSPIIVNAQMKTAAQVILEDDLPLRYPLVQGRNQKPAKEGA